MVSGGRIHYRDGLTNVREPEDLARVFILDVLIQNPDRTAMKLLLQRSGRTWDVIPIDHAEAFVLEDREAASMEGWMHGFPSANRAVRSHLARVVQELDFMAEDDIRECCDGVEELLDVDSRRQAEKVLLRRVQSGVSLMPENFR